MTDSGIVLFRLQGHRLVMCKWKDLKAYLTKDSMMYNERELNHWKLRIFEDHIRINGNPRDCAIQMI